MGINERNNITADLKKAYLEAPNAQTASAAGDAILCSSNYDNLPNPQKLYILAWVCGFETALWEARGWNQPNSGRLTDYVKNDHIQHED